MPVACVQQATVAAPLLCSPPRFLVSNRSCGSNDGSRCYEPREGITTVHEPKPLIIPVALQRDAQGVRLGARVVLVGGSGCNKAVIVKSSESGLIPQWNEQYPEKALIPGDAIVEVNGKTSAMEIMEELLHSASLNLVVSRAADSEAWKNELREMGVEIEFATHQGGVKQFGSLVCLPKVPAGEAGVDQCAICMEGVGADESIAVLQCGHGFHHACLARWIVQGSRPVCPLCIRPVA